LGVSRKVEPLYAFEVSHGWHKLRKKTMLFFNMGVWLRLYVVEEPFVGKWNLPSYEIKIWGKSLWVCGISRK
jgi:hypothetical protein